MELVNIYEEIANKIAISNEKSIDTYIRRMDVRMSDSIELSRLGFTSCLNVTKNKLNKQEIIEIERAKLFDYFGKMILTDNELNQLCKQYNLVKNTASRFMDVIPDQNIKEILDFVRDTRKKKWNFGTLETDGYHIPLTTEFEVTAPQIMFRKPLNIQEMNPKELEKWKKEDPIITKSIFKFDRRSSNNPTGFNIVITAWGLEALLLETSINTEN